LLYERHHSLGQAGGSGNPTGRSRQSKNGKTLLQQELNEIVLVNEDGIPTDDQVPGVLQDAG